MNQQEEKYEILSIRRTRERSERYDIDYIKWEIIFSFTLQLLTALIQDSEFPRNKIKK